MLYEQLEKRFGQERGNPLGSPTVVATKPASHPHAKPDHSGFATLMSFVDPSDPEAPTTIHGHRFSCQTLPKPSRRVAATLAMPDPGSVHFVGHVVAGGPPKLGLATDTTAALRSRTAKTAPSVPVWVRSPTPAPGCSPSRAICPTRCWSAPRTPPAVIPAR